METWTSIKGQEGYFEVSDLGNIRSYKGVGRISKILKEVADRL